MVDDEKPEWTDEMFEKAVTFSELPISLQTLLNRMRTPQKTTKVPLSSQTIFGSCQCRYSRCRLV